MESLVVKTTYSDHVEYRLNGELHREDGPAVERATGSKENEANEQ